MTNRSVPIGCRLDTAGCHTDGFDDVNVVVEIYSRIRWVRIPHGRSAGEDRDLFDRKWLDAIGAILRVFFPWPFCCLKMTVLINTMHHVHAVQSFYDRLHH